MNKNYDNFDFYVFDDEKWIKSNINKDGISIKNNVIFNSNTPTFDFNIFNDQLNQTYTTSLDASYIDDIEVKFPSSFEQYAGPIPKFILD
ncbi:MAG: hypothetical protein ACXW1A_05650 [Nitrososphaeraceae archaeon]